MKKIMKKIIYRGCLKDLVYFIGGLFYVVDRITYHRNSVRAGHFQCVRGPAVQGLCH